MQSTLPLVVEFALPFIMVPFMPPFEPDEEASRQLWSNACCAGVAACAVGRKARRSAMARIGARGRIGSDTFGADGNGFWNNRHRRARIAPFFSWKRTERPMAGARLPTR